MISGLMSKWVLIFNLKMITNLMMRLKDVVWNIYDATECKYLGKKYFDHETRVISKLQVLTSCWKLPRFIFNLILKLELQVITRGKVCLRYALLEYYWHKFSKEEPL